MKTVGAIKMYKQI